MYVVLALICINEETEYDDVESFRALPINDAAQTPTMEEVQYADITEQALGINKFVSLISFDEEENGLLSFEISLMDHMTSSRKRILRERLAKKPSQIPLRDPS